MNAPQAAVSASPSEDRLGGEPPGGDPLAHIAPALFAPMGVDGVYARTALYVRICEGLEAYITSLREPGVEVMRFPPVMSRKQLEKSGYLKSFPNLLGCVCALHGTEPVIRAAADRLEQGGDWTAALSASDLVLSPAACYPVYPIAAARGALPAGGWQFDIEADVFRHEPSRSLDRLLTYAEGNELNSTQTWALSAEMDEGGKHSELFGELHEALQKASRRVRAFVFVRCPRAGRLRRCRWPR